MDFTLEALKERIEFIREYLLKLISYKELTDNLVVNCSQELDILLTEYEKLKRKYPPNDAA